MQYREIGKTGKLAGTIGLGCEHLDGKPSAQVTATIESALENGINLFDVFMPGQEIRRNIAEALGSRRKEVMIQGHLGSTDIRQQYDISRDMPTVRRYFEELLRLYGYIDFGMLFFIDSETDFKNIFETEFATYAMNLKQKGDILHIGFSSHNPVIARKAVETGLPEMMMFSINPAFDLAPADSNVLSGLEEGFYAEAFRGPDPVRSALYKVCQQRNVGITVMKTFGAGKLLSKEHTPFAQPLTPAQCIHYALTRPSVSSVLLGCETPEQILNAMEYFDKTEAEKDYSEILGTLKNDFKGNCVYCSHCLPCPADIDIAAVNKYLDIARLDTNNIPPSIRSHYTSLAAHGSDCIACGSCERRCPFDVQVIENMAEAGKLFKV